MSVVKKVFSEENKLPENRIPEPSKLLICLPPVDSEIKKVERMLRKYLDPLYFRFIDKPEFCGYLIEWRSWISCEELRDWFCGKEKKTQKQKGIFNFIYSKFHPSEKYNNELLMIEYYDENDFDFLDLKNKDVFDEVFNCKYLGDDGVFYLHVTPNRINFSTGVSANIEDLYAYPIYREYLGSLKKLFLRGYFKGTPSYPFVFEQLFRSVLKEKANK